jgi:trimeric autotransporter adhesin
MSRTATASPRRVRGRHPGRREWSTGATGALALILTAPVVAVMALPGLARAQDVPPGGGYSLAATVSPSAMTPAACTPGQLCVPASAPIGGAADDQPALAASVALAATMAVPAAVDVSGTVTTPARPATVFLGAGTYVLGRPLLLPPNVDLRGSGITATTVLLAPESWGNFHYSFLIKPDGTTSAGSANLVSDLTVNGSCKKGAGAPDPRIAPVKTCDLGADPNHGGGVKAGDRWTVRQVRFTNLNYFKLWIAGTTDARAVDNRFDSWGGAGSSDEDNIGGGSNSVGTVVEYNQFDETMRGTGIDFTNASGVTIGHNTIHATRQYLAFRGVDDYGSIIMEGVTSSTIADNVLYGSHLVLQSNSRYDHSGNNKNVTNARSTTVSGNQIVDSFQTGITVVYDDYVDETAPHARANGGLNVLADNEIIHPTLSGILIISCGAGIQDAADTITANTITDAGFGGSTSFATGCGTFDTTGVGIATDVTDLVYGNRVIDDQATPTTWYGVHIGPRSGAKVTTPRPVLTDATGQAPNTASGIAGSLIRVGAAAPASPTDLSAVRAGQSVRLAWKDAAQTVGFAVGGYRIYRNGSLMATIPMANPTIAGNLVSDAQFSMESGVTGWVKVTTRTVIGRNTTVGAVGTASLALSATGGGGQIAAVGSSVPVTPGATYTSTASFRALGTGGKARAGIAWIDANDKTISKVLPSTNILTDAADSWLTSTYTTTAPSTAVKAQPFVVVDDCVDGQTHLVDRVGIVGGTATQTWTDVNALTGANTYQVVSYRAVDGENSALAAVAVA